MLAHVRKNHHNKKPYDRNRSARRKARSPDTDYKPPACTDRYCRGEGDACRSCKDGATTPQKSVSKPVKERQGQRHRPADVVEIPICRDCLTRDDLLPFDDGYWMCGDCTEKRLKRRMEQLKLDEEKRKKTVALKAVGKACVCCGHDRNDKGKELNQSRWICQYCNRDPDHKVCPVCHQFVPPLTYGISIDYNFGKFGGRGLVHHWCFKELERRSDEQERKEARETLAETKSPEGVIFPRSAERAMEALTRSELARLFVQSFDYSKVTSPVAIDVMIRDYVKEVTGREASV